MTSTATGSRTGHRTGTLTGTLTLLRFMLRRDRIRTTAWIIGLGLFAFYCAVVEAGETLVGDEENLAGVAVLFLDPVGRMIMGPGYGMEDPTFQRLFAAGYAIFIYIGFALMSVFTVIRHTRVDEQAGRTELVRANIVGRHATLTAALILTVVANVAAGLLVFGAAVTADFDVHGSLLIAACSVAVGLFFMGAAAVSAQLNEFSRGATGMAAGLIGASYVIRMGGDVAEAGGSTLSWASPLGWAQQTAPYVLDRWWPLFLLVGGAVVLTATGVWLSTKRDVGAGLLHTRRGRPEAAAWLGTPVGMALRTLRGGLRSWGMALVVAALLLGGFSQPLVDAQDDLPEAMKTIIGGDDLILGFQSFIALIIAMFIAASAVSALQQVRDEEVRGRAEFGLSAPVGRVRWLGAHLVVILGAVALTLLLTGLGAGAGAVAVLGDDGWSTFADVALAVLLYAPAVLATMGIVVALFGWLPRWAGPVGWTLLGFAVLETAFGEMLGLPDWLRSLNIFGHLAQYPAVPVEVAPVLWLTGIGVLGIAAGLVGWRHREVNRV